MIRPLFFTLLLLAAAPSLSWAEEAKPMTPQEELEAFLKTSTGSDASKTLVEENEDLAKAMATSAAKLTEISASCEKIEKPEPGSKPDLPAIVKKLDTCFCSNSDAFYDVEKTKTAAIGAFLETHPTFAGHYFVVKSKANGSWTVAPESQKLVPLETLKKAHHCS